MGDRHHHRPVHRAAHRFGDLARQALAAITQHTIRGFDHTRCNECAVTEQEKERHEGEEKNSQPLQQLAAQRACPRREAVQIHVAEPGGGGLWIAEIGPPPRNEILARNWQPCDRGRNWDAGPSELANPFHEGVTALRDLVDRHDDRHDENGPDQEGEQQRSHQLRRTSRDEGAEAHVSRPSRDGYDGSPCQWVHKAARHPERQSCDQDRENDSGCPANAGVIAQRGLVGRRNLGCMVTFGYGLDAHTPSTPGAARGPEHGISAFYLGHIRRLRVQVSLRD